MRYSLYREKCFERDLKSFKRDNALNTEIKKAIGEIFENPSIGTPYDRKMDGLIKYKITIKEEYEYRLIYSVSECCNSKWEFCEDSTNCGGLIRLIFFRTREACNNLYHNKVAIENALNNTTATEKSKSS